MNKRGGVFGMGLEETMWIALGALVILSIIGLGVKLYTVGAGDLQEQAMSSDVDRLNTQIQDLIDKPSRWASTETTLNLQGGAVLVGYNSNWDSSVDATTCAYGGDRPAILPIACKKEPCIVLYSDDFFDDPQGTDTYRLTQGLFGKDKNIIFMGEPPTGVVIKDNSARGVPTYSQPVNTLYAKAQEIDYTTFFIFGNCLGLRALPRNAQFYIDKFVDDNGDAYIFISEIREDNKKALEERKKYLKKHFGLALRELQEAFDKKDFDLVLKDGRKLEIEPGDRGKLATKGQIDDLYYLLGKTFFTLAENYEKYKDIATDTYHLISFELPDTSQETMYRKAAEYFLLTLHIDAKPLEQFPNLPQELSKALLNLPLDEAFAVANEPYREKQKNRITKRIIVQNYKHFQDLDSKLNLFLSLHTAIRAGDYPDEQRKMDSYLLIESYLKKPTAKDVTYALATLREMKEFFGQNLDSEGYSWNEFIGGICHPSPTIYFTKDSFSEDDFAKITTDCVLTTGQGTPQQKLIALQQSIEEAESAKNTTAIVTNSIDLLSLIKNKFMPEELELYKTTFMKVTENLPQTQEQAELQQEFEHTFLTRKGSMSFFTEYTEGLQDCGADNQIDCINKLEQLFPYFPVNLFHFSGLQPEYEPFLLALTNAYEETNQQQRCQDKIVSQIQTTSEFWDNLKTKCTIAQNE